ncbi:unnamed protein product [Gordionus sp. m RMFG-2023]
MTTSYYNSAPPLNFGGSSYSPRLSTKCVYCGNITPVQDSAGPEPPRNCFNCGQEMRPKSLSGMSGPNLQNLQNALGYPSFQQGGLSNDGNNPLKFAQNYYGMAGGPRGDFGGGGYGFPAPSGPSLWMGGAGAPNPYNVTNLTLYFENNSDNTFYLLFNNAILWVLKQLQPFQSAPPKQFYPMSMGGGGDVWGGGGYPFDPMGMQGLMRRSSPIMNATGMDGMFSGPGQMSYPPSSGTENTLRESLRQLKSTIMDLKSTSEAFGAATERKLREAYELKTGGSQRRGSSLRPFLNTAVSKDTLKGLRALNDPRGKKVTMLMDRRPSVSRSMSRSNHGSLASLLSKDDLGSVASSKSQSSLTSNPSITSLSEADDTMDESSVASATSATSLTGAETSEEAESGAESAAEGKKDKKAKKEKKAKKGKKEKGGSKASKKSKKDKKKKDKKGKKGGSKKSKKGKKGKKGSKGGKKGGKKGSKKGSKGGKKGSKKGKKKK